MTSVFEKNTAQFSTLLAHSEGRLVLKVKIYEGLSITDITVEAGNFLDLLAQLAARARDAGFDSADVTRKALCEIFLYAAKTGNIEVARALLDAGADVHMDNEQPLRNAVDYGRTEMVKLLLSRGADAQVSGALIEAVKINNVPIIQLLSPNVNDFQVIEDLRVAVRMNHLDAALALLQRKPSMNTVLVKEIILRVTYSDDVKRYQVLVALAQQGAGFACLPQFKDLTQDQIIEQLVALAVEQELMGQD